MKAPCKHREENPRHLKVPFSLTSCYTSCHYTRSGADKCISGRGLARGGGVREGREMVSLQNTPQLQHPHLSDVLAKLMCPLPPRQTHAHAPWVPSLRLLCWGHLARSLGGSAGGITYLPQGCTMVAEPMGPLNCGHMNVAVLQQPSCHRAHHSSGRREKRVKACGLKHWMVYHFLTA